MGKGTREGDGAAWTEKRFPEGRKHPPKKKDLGGGRGGRVLDEKKDKKGGA